MLVRMQSRTHIHILLLVCLLTMTHSLTMTHPLRFGEFPNQSESLSLAYMCACVYMFCVCMRRSDDRLGYFLQKHCPWVLKQPLDLELTNWVRLAGG